MCVVKTGSMRLGLRDGEGSLEVFFPLAEGLARWSHSGADSDRADGQGSSEGSGSGGVKDSSEGSTDLQTPRIVRESYKGAFGNGVFHGRGQLTRTFLMAPPEEAKAGAEASESQIQEDSKNGADGSHTDESTETQKAYQRLRRVTEYFSGTFANGLFHGGGLRRFEGTSFSGQVIRCREMDS